MPRGKKSSIASNPCPMMTEEEYKERFLNIKSANVKLLLGARNLDIDAITASIKNGASIDILDNWGYGLTAHAVEALCDSKENYAKLDDFLDSLDVVFTLFAKDTEDIDNSGEYIKLPCLINSNAINPLAYAASEFGSFDVLKCIEDWLGDSSVNAPGRDILGSKTLGVVPAMLAEDLDYLSEMDDLAAIDYSICDGAGDSILHHQVALYHDDIIESLVNRDEIDLNYQNFKGETPVMRLLDDDLTDDYFAEKAIKILRVLLKNGADLHTKTNEGKDFLYYLINYVKSYLTSEDKLEGTAIEFFNFAQEAYYQRVQLK